MKDTELNMLKKKKESQEGLPLGEVQQGWSIL